MPVFQTPEAVDLTLEVGSGEIHIAASDRADTVVDVHPADPAKKRDVAAARDTRVEHDGGRLLVKTPRSLRRYTSRDADAVRVEIALPSGSQVRVKADASALRATGRLGASHVSIGAGEARLDETGPLELRLGAGDAAVDRVAGRADVASGSGRIALGLVEGPAAVRNANGDTWIGAVAGDVRATSANGTIAVDRAARTVAAKTANGDVRIGSVAHGAIVAETGLGHVEVGVPAGVAAWLDLHTRFGAVRNELEAAERPAAGDAAVEVRARTSFGDITIRRPAADRALLPDR
jgi:DUF4097 and DUF4098 domain-containing protein YvlB